MSSLLDGEKKFSWHDISYRAKSAFAVILALAVLLGGGLFVGLKAKGAWDDFRQRDDYIGDGTDPVTVTIPPGSSLYRVADILEQNEVIRSAKTFDGVAAAEPKASQIQAGQYRLKKHLPAEKAMAMLLDPANLVRNKITIPEGLRLAAQLKILSDKTGIPVKDFEAALADPAKVKLAPLSGGKPEGFLFPDTYEFPDNTPPEKILQTLSDKFTAMSSDLQLELQAKNLGKSPYEIVTIASIIEGEALKPEDRPKVARVIYNRLAKGMPLQMDSTVKYVTGKDGKVTTTDADRATDSPYNTYKVAGLPPGPIGAPGRASLQAALAPSAGDWLYFVTVNLDTGETLFANTPEEHEANVKKFQDWCKQAGNANKC